ncbi:MAG TPA: oligopeptide/dipeptide ABC transporter ATP-binding protein, partial [Hyphomicrobiaceae bacterium]|nr:oligopeptide/dipeptide ABC transporter ATP-binding protein [Hyphomicrobiaceae bacterium]
TVGRAIIQLPPPTSGQVLLKGRDLCMLRGEELRRRRTSIQMVFQDPISSLNPRRNIGDIVEAPLAVAGVGTTRQRRKMAEEMLDAVGLDPLGVWGRRPHELSGGQCQRVSIARALMPKPEVLVCDEPVSSLDVSVQAQILNVLQDAKERFGVILLFIAHDLAVVKNISDRVAVMYLGRLCELASSDRLYEQPAHPYTRALLAAVPDVRPQPKMHIKPVLQGEVPSPLAPPSGCRFRTRCPLATERCASEVPQMQRIRDDHIVACHHPLQ